MKHISAPISFTILIAVSASAQPARTEPQPAAHHVVPLKVLTKLPSNKRVEKVAGDPAIAGAPFVIRIHAEAGYIIMPHTHQVDENIVVVKGTWAFGMGTKVNREVLEIMEVGDYAFAPKDMAHFAVSKTATIIQVHGVGPFATRWVVPMYELADQGVVMRKTAGGPGQSVSAAPEGCFLLKLGAHVKGGNGEGVIVGAQCTPGQLTQYRIETADGELFWARRDDLTPQ